LASIGERAEKAATASPVEKGRHAETPAEIPAPGWKEIAFRTWKESSKDNVSLVAAGVAFYGQVRWLWVQQEPRRCDLLLGVLAAPEHRNVVHRARVAGMRHVGMISTALSTLGLSMLCRRGALLLASAAGLSLLKRDD
jgi:hypothetical protein